MTKNVITTKKTGIMKNLCPRKVQKIIGIIAVLTAGLIWAIEPVLSRMSYTENTGIIQTSAVRALFCAIIALLYAVVTARKSLLINRKQFGVITYITISGTVIADLLYYLAMTKTTILNAVLIGHLQPVFIVLIGFLILHEDKLRIFDYIGIFLMITAGSMVMIKTPENLLSLKIGTSGDLLVLCATFFWATAGIAARKYLHGINSGTITFYRFGLAAIFLIGYLLVMGNFRISNIYQIILGVSIGIGYILYYEGLKRLKAAQVGALELSAPVFAGLFGYIFMNELMTPMQIGGIVILFVGIHFISKRESH